MKLGRPFFVSVALLLTSYAAATNAETVRLESFLGSPGNPVAASDSLPIPPDPLPPGVIQVGISPPKPCGVSDVQMVFSGCTCNIQFLGSGRDENGIYLRVEIRPGIVCFDCGLDSVYVPLGTLAPGYHVAAYRIEADIIHADGTLEHATRTGSLSFEVAQSCPPPSGIQYIQRIEIEARVPCYGCPPVVCAGDSIRVRLAGYVPDTCHRFEGIELIEPPYGSPLPYPPIVRVKIGTNNCLRIPCALVITPWEAEVTLPPLPERDYTLVAEAAVTDHCDGSVEIAQHEERPFKVGAPCGACFSTRWLDETDPGDGCDAQVSDERPAIVRLGISSSAEIAGLQGKLRFFEPKLEVRKVETVGPAGSFALQWRRTEEGAEFVLFSTDGSVISPSDAAQPILAVTCGAKPGVEIPPFTSLHLLEAIAADPRGGSVPLCPEIALMVVSGARICRSAPCDVNGDGAADVRDLVAFVNCVRDPAVCPDAERAHVDCDADGGVDLDDVLCCARRILHHGLPDSIPARDEPSVAVSFAAPVRTPAGYDIEVTLHGADRIGAARLALGYPQRAFTVAGVEFPDAGADWLAMHDVDTDGLLLGWIGLSEPSAPGSVRAIVHLVATGQSASGGELRLREVDLAGRDGVPIVDPAGDISMPLSPRLVLALSAPRPNPFQGFTEFALTSNEDAEVDVAVYDLAGRVVTSLYRGPVAAGQRSFQWNGSANGVRLRSGLYFVRAQSGAAVALQRVVILGGEGYRLPLE